MTSLIPILGDQLSHDLSALDGADPASTIVLAFSFDDWPPAARYGDHSAIAMS